MSKPHHTSTYHYTFNPRYQIGTQFQQPDQKTNFQTQKARDPFGNVRWQGAFTGGFEAGYKNTCGSKQGWVPSSFVSSRTNRFEKDKKSDIMDYMDDEDVGGLNIATNIQIREQFRHEKDSAHPVPDNQNIYSNVLMERIKSNESIGDQIFKKMKHQQAQLNAPENLSQLQQLLENYRENEIIDEHARQYSDQYQNRVGNQNKSHSHYSAGCFTQPPEDQFMNIYTELFNRVIRKPTLGYNDEENEENQRNQRQKQRKENMIFFDFTKPLEEEPDYLRQIKQIEEYEEQESRRKPRKRVKNIINQIGLQQIFTIKDSVRISQNQINKNNSFEEYMLRIPESYDPYHRVKAAKEKEKQLMINPDEEHKPKHRIFSVSQRSDIIGENKGKLSQKFVKPGVTTSSFSNRFVRSGQEQLSKQAKDSLSSDKNPEKIFEQVQKNERFWDYVLELEGKKISAQLNNLSFEQGEKERKQFELKYEQIKKKREAGSKTTNTHSKGKTPKEADKEKKTYKVIRKTGTWKPERVLCKRFGCMVPYMEEQKTKNKSREQRPYF